MKILIISTARSGSTSLFKSFTNVFPYCVGFNEPFNSETLPTSTSPYHLEYDNMVVKFLSNQIPSICYNLFHRDTIYEYALEFFIKEVIPKFQKVILLTRLDDYKSIESFYFSSQTQNWHGLYKPYNKIPPQQIPLLLDHHIFSKSIIYGLSNILNIPITYYEDLFMGNKNKIKNFLTQSKIEVPNFEKFYSYLDPSKKYRQN
jgi:hypothetical protein